MSQFSSSTPWHTIPPEELAAQLESSLQNGLPQERILDLQNLHGTNELKGRAGKGFLLIFLSQFNQPLVYLLLLATAVTLALQKFVDSSVIFGVVLINAIIGFIQEFKAEAAIEALSRMVVTEATVRRNNEWRKMPSRELVPGDVVALQSGDKVPADLRLFKVRDLRTEEAALTGESLPVEKFAAPLPEATVLGDRRNMAFAGTLVTYGQAEGLVIATGNKTETGRIARLLDNADLLATPLTRKIARFSHRLLWIILGFTALAIVAGFMHGQGFVYVFKAAVALAVGAIPEGLPAAVTITLAIGVSRMAARSAIIRKLPAVETLGSTTVICSDKTGTLTENKMTVQGAWINNATYKFTGAGYEANGEILHNDQKIDANKDSALSELMRCGLLCNDTRLRREEGVLKVEGDPTEACLLVSAAKAGLQNADQLQNWPRLDSIPFESEHQYMATLHRNAKESVVYVKGSVERILDLCKGQWLSNNSSGELQPHQVQDAVANFAAQGMRVLAFARATVSEDIFRIDHQSLKSLPFGFIGLQAMIDPPRMEVVEAVRKCHGAGILVKMITGDHALTAKAIAKQIGLRDGADFSASACGRVALAPVGELSVLTGQQLTQISDSDLPPIAYKTSVFARVAPEEKLRLVRALQSSGQVCAMTGDGVNDAPALKQADIGIAMGITGTEVSKGAADMILTDDNFASIQAAVEEGRAVFDNIVKFLLWALPTNAGGGLILLAGILAGTALPATPVQVLWINMTTAVLLGITLVFEKREPGLMERLPRNPSAPLMRTHQWIRLGYVAVIMLIGAFGFFIYELSQGFSEAAARTVVVNVVVVVQMAYLLSCRSLTLSPARLGWFSNRILWGGLTAMTLSQMAFTYLPIMNKLFGSAPLPAHIWLQIFGVGLVTFLVVETEKWLRRR